MSFKKVRGYENYEVSDTGQVRNIITGKSLTPTPRDTTGHLSVGLTKNGKRKRFSVHRLVLMAFVGPCPDGMECCHKNGDPKDNHVTNLRWGTRQSNMKDRVLHGLTNAGSNNKWAKLTEKEVMEIRSKYKYFVRGFTTVDLAKEYGVCQQTINKIVKHQMWKHV